jgi:hypothetical protein
VDKAYFLSDERLDELKLRELFERQIITDRAFSKMFHITKEQISLVEKQTGALVGTAVDFWHNGGWLKKMILPEASSTICPQYPNHTMPSSLWRKVVRPQLDVQSGGK